MHATRQDELSTWQEIAKYLGVGVRTAQNYERVGLPIHRVAGEGRGRVLAFKPEIDRWKAERLISNTESPPAPAEDTAALSECAEEVCESSVQPPARSLSSRPMLIGLGLAMGCVLVATAGYGLKQERAYRRMSDFRVEGKNLVVVNESQELWRHTFPVPLASARYEGPDQLSAGWIGALEPAGRPELVFMNLPVNFKSAGSTVLCFDRYGRTRWEFPPVGRTVTDASGDRMGPPFFALAMEVLRGRHPAETRIVVSSAHHLNQPDQVAFLGTRGQVLGEYWHPGHLKNMAQADLDGDGANELILAGVNNGEHQATVVVLDPLQISGLMTPPQMRDQRFRLLNMQAAKEKAVVLFPRSCISTGLPYTRASRLHVTRDRIIVDVAEGEDESGAGFVYELDYGLHVLSIVPNGARVMQTHAQLETKGVLDHSFDASKECELLKAGVVVRKGY